MVQPESQTIIGRLLITLDRQSRREQSGPAMRMILTLGWVVLLAVPGLAGAGAYTPKPGSAERKAICDALRSYTRRE